MRPFALLLVLLFTPAVYAQAVTVTGARDSAGNLQPAIVCDQFAAISNTFGSAGTFKLLAATAGKKIYTCGFYLTTSQQAAVSLFETTDTGCSTAAGDRRNVTGLGTFPPGGGVVMSLAPFAVSFTQNASTNLCLSVSTATVAGGWIAYAVL